MLLRSYHRGREKPESSRERGQCHAMTASWQAMMRVTSRSLAPDCKRSDEWSSALTAVGEVRRTYGS